MNFTKTTIVLALAAVIAIAIPVRARSPLTSQVITSDLAKIGFVKGGNVWLGGDEYSINSIKVEGSDKDFTISVKFR
jgi:predicted secreted protein